MGKWTARAIGENNYEYFRLEKRIFYARYYYTKQAILNQKGLCHSPRSWAAAAQGAFDLEDF